MNNTSNEYTLQSVYNANSYICTITELPQVSLAICDTNAQPFVYTSSEHIDITNNNISLKFTMEMNNEIVLNPRAYDNAVFGMLSGTCRFAFRQNTIHGGQPIAQFYPSTKACTFHCDCEIPNMYNKTSVDLLIAYIYINIYTRADTDTLFSNIDLSKYYTKSDVDDTSNELSTLVGYLY